MASRELWDVVQHWQAELAVQLHACCRASQLQSTLRSGATSADALVWPEGGLDL